MSAEGPSAYIQWKGTDVCMDFKCACGLMEHIDCIGVYAIQCGNCGAIYEMPTLLPLTRNDATKHTPVVARESKE